MTDAWQLALRYTGHVLLHPAGTHQIFRSDEMIGDSGRLFVSRIGADVQIEVGYDKLAGAQPYEVVVEGVPIARVRRMPDGTIVGEWIRPAVVVAPPPGPPPPGPAPVGPGRAPAPAVATPPPPTPSTRACDSCARFRPYVRVSERLAQELGGSLAENAIATALNDIVKEEERGKGEEARHLADLYRRGAMRWPNHPSYFAYCGAHERDAREPAFFIAQIRNADQRCRPVQRADGQKWSDAPTDFAVHDGVPLGCATCAHRVVAPGPSADAKDIREIVAAATQAMMMSAAASRSGEGGGAASGVLSSFPQQTRQNAATARAREMAEAFARRGASSHASIEPRYLDRCGLRSDPAAHRYRVCAVENPNERCSDWTPPAAPVTGT